MGQEEGYKEQQGKDSESRGYEPRGPTTTIPPPYSNIMRVIVDCAFYIHKGLEIAGKGIRAVENTANGARTSLERIVDRVADRLKNKE